MLMLTPPLTNELILWPRGLCQRQVPESDRHLPAFFIIFYIMFSRAILLRFTPLVDIFLLAHDLSGVA
jgi:hypothetical protein